MSYEQTTELSPTDRATLTLAVDALERTTLAGRLTTALGRPVELAGTMLPNVVRKSISGIATRALKVAMRVALTGLKSQKKTDNRAFHRTVAAAAGAAGGALGLASLAVELPVSTVIILRSIADIARSEGEDLSDPEAALACLQVFALDGRAQEADFSEGGYFAIRSMLAKSISEAASYVAQKGAADEAAPILLKLMGQIANRFGLVVSQKFVAQAVPIVGAVGGAAVNLTFLQHYQALAKAHFSIRRLERAYSPELVRAEYEKISAATPSK